MSERPVSTYNGVFSCLVAAGEMNRLLDEFYADPQQARLHEDGLRIAQTAPQHATRVPSGFDEYRSRRGD